MVNKKLLTSGIIASSLVIAGIAGNAVAQGSSSDTAAPAAPDMSALATASPANTTKIVASAVTANPTAGPAIAAAAVTAAPGSALLVVSAAAGVPSVDVAGVVAGALSSMTPQAQAASAAVLLAAAAKASGQDIKVLAAAVCALVPGLGDPAALADAASKVDLQAALAAAGATGATTADEGTDAAADATPPEPAALSDGSATAITGAGS